MKKWWEKIILVGVVAVALWLRLVNLGQPNHYYFDEVYHIPTAKLMLKEDARAYEWSHGELSELGIEEQSGTWIDWLHPPLNKYLQAVSMGVLGMDKPLAWRISSAVFGVGVVILVYSIMKKLFPKMVVARLVAALLAAIDPMLVMQSRIGMNDMGVIFWMMLGVRMWLWSLDEPRSWWRWSLMSVIWGLAISTKWSVALIAPVIMVVSMSKMVGQKIAQVLGKLELTLIIMAVIYILVYSPMFFLGKSSEHFLLLHQQIWAYQNRTDLEHYAASVPLEWVWGQKEIYYNAVDPDIYLRDNLGLMTSVVVSCLLTILAGGYVIAKQKGKLINETQRNMALLLALYIMAFLPWQLANRIMFLYHYLPALVFGLMLLGVWINIGVDYLRNKLRKTS